jgi:hypothetical protein
MFGDMTDAFGFGQVDGCDQVRGEADGELAVLVAGADGQALSPKGLRHFPQTALEADVVFGARHDAQDLAFVIFGRGQALWHRPRAWAVAAGGRLLVQRFMRAFEIIDLAPSIEGALDLGLVGEALHGEDFGLEGAMEALVLAAALRVIGPGIDDFNAQLQKPEPQAVQWPEASPHGRAVIDEQASGKP